MAIRTVPDTGDQRREAKGLAPPRWSKAAAVDPPADARHCHRAAWHGVATDSVDDTRRRLVVVAGLSAPVVVLTAMPVLQFDYWQWLSLSLVAPIVTLGAWPFHRAAWKQARQGRATVAALVTASAVAGFTWSAWALFLGGGGGRALRQGLGLSLARHADGPPIFLAAVGVIVTAALAARYLATTEPDAGGPCHVDSTDGSARRFGPATAAAPIRLAARELGGSPRPRRPGEPDTLVGPVDVPASACGHHDPFGAERIAGWLGPAVVILAASTLGFWLAASGDGADAAAFATATLVLACPAGLGFARSLPFVLGAPRLRQLGIEIEQPAVLAAARTVDTIVLRKPGTLTTGRSALPEGQGRDARDALLAPADTVRPTAARAVAALQELGVLPVLLTADRRDGGEPVAGVVGIDEVVGGVPASRTASAIARLQDEGRVVAAMGDSVHDAAALAQADLGIAHRPCGDVIGVIHPSLERTELWTVVDAIRLGRTLDHIVRSNVVLAAAANLVALPLAAGGRLSPAGMLVVMGLSAATVVANSLRLHRFHRLRPPAHRRATNAPAVSGWPPAIVSAPP
ncbi:MAG: HAD family hydrolase [Acidimicrobiales bacterium]